MTYSIIILFYAVVCPNGKYNQKWTLHIQNPGALSKSGVKPPENVLTALNIAKKEFIADDKAINTEIAASKQGKAKWDSAPLGPAKVQ